MQLAFLDEFRMVILHNATELIVFNTLIPQGRPGNLRRLGLPHRFRDRAVYIILDNDRLFGTLNKDEPFTADPAQAVIVLGMVNDWDPHVFLVMRIQALVEQTLLACTDSRIPWNEWRGDAVVVESPIDAGEPEIFVHDAQVVVVWVDFTGDWGVQTFDFSRRGRSSLPPWIGGGGEIKRTGLEEYCDHIFKPSDDVDPWSLGSLSDGSLFFLVSCFPRSVGSEVTC